MNKLEFKSPYLSITTFDAIELNPLTILTGLNGSGKSHLLQSILNGSSIIDGYKPNDIRYFDYRNFNAENEKSTSDIEINTIKTDLLQGLNESTWKNQIDDIKRRFSSLFPIYIEKAKEFGLPLWNLAGKFDVQNDIINYNNFVPQYQNALTIKVNNKSFSLHALALDILGEITDEEIVKLYTNNPLKDNFLPAQLSKVFLEYHQLYFHEVIMAKAQSEEYGELPKLKDRNDFEELYGPKPWVIINEIMNDSFGMNFEISNPEDIRFKPYVRSEFTVSMKDKISGQEINFEDLSSGERILFALVLSIYKGHLTGTFPSVLLLDEIDASLHPLMIKNLLKAIREQFVLKNKMLVIMTTHSPSTIALSEENELYVVNKETPRIQLTSKDSALKILTTGVPSFSVNYENRRQIFVESSYDANYYERIYNCLAPYLIPEVSLSFIGSGPSGRGNCTQVIAVVKSLFSNGNKSIYGIIDWDLKNNPEDNICVLGQNERYSMENYILDPLLIAYLLIREKAFTTLELGLSSDIKYKNADDLNVEERQILINNVTNKVAANITITDTTLCKVKYINGLELEIPKWYLQYQGHELETLIKKTFPTLNRFHKEPDLKYEIIGKIIDESPGLTPKDILKTFLYIQKN